LVSAWIVELVIFSTKLAVGYLLDELKNDITRETPLAR
jgi:carbamoylphosphate synthase large subunit